ncbi:DNA-binding response regulator [Streptomyces tateyamensis]|uniref:DNA-binding response regulator n=1 Tax=Streptomyces tateyamensis TaxID=565073 RepID=A0A2V4NPG8_9ACTN|nr:DNA-binding response regulator [Streptomyces tateyamensis]
MRVHVRAADPAVRGRLAARVVAGGAEPAAEWAPGAVVGAAADTVDGALEACPPTAPGGYPLVVVADRFPTAEVVRALRAGTGTLLPSGRATPDRLAAAARAAYHGEDRLPHEVLVRLPHEVLVRLINGKGTEPPAAGPPAAGAAEKKSPLTARQTAVLSLVADGHDNAAIARTLDCSPHTVKNVIYELMARLRVNNRAHAVARAVRLGLV